MTAANQAALQAAWAAAAPAQATIVANLAIQLQLQTNTSLISQLQSAFGTYLTQQGATSAQLLAMATDHGPLYAMMQLGAVETAYEYVQAMTSDAGFTQAYITELEQLFLQFFPSLASS
jgi:hypothetical protein